MAWFDSLRVRVRRKGKIDIPRDQLVILSKRVLEGESFSDRHLLGFSSEGCHFRRCSFERMKIESASFGAGTKESVYEDCQFDGSEIHGLPGIARFYRCSFRNIRLDGFFSLAASFIECVFSGEIRGSVFYGSLPASNMPYGKRQNEFFGNDFSETLLVDVDFRDGIDLSKQHMPKAWLNSR
jgi:uncharacterized protein YjbI with pentapeptide repeats